MVTVRHYDLAKPKDLKAIEARIKRELKKQGLAGTDVSLFRTQDGKVGYSARVEQVLPAAENRRALELVHRIVCKAIGYKRGRPPGEPTRQVKCRVPARVYRKLVREAKKRSVSPSGLVAELVERQIGA